MPGGVYSCDPQCPVNTDIHVLHVFVCVYTSVCLLACTCLTLYYFTHMQVQVDKVTESRQACWVTDSATINSIKEITIIIMMVKAVFHILWAIGLLCSTPLQLIEHGTSVSQDLPFVAIITHANQTHSTCDLPCGFKQVYY